MIAVFATYITNLQNETRKYVCDSYPENVTEEVIPLLRPTCENWCQIGDYYSTMGEKVKAEKYYQLAAYMIPTRILPNYSLWKLYLSQERGEEAFDMADKILKQPLKITNTYTLRIRSEVAMWQKIFKEE